MAQMMRSSHFEPIGIISVKKKNAVVLKQQHYKEQIFGIT